jgi:hypothetical protein
MAKTALAHKMADTRVHAKASKVKLGFLSGGMNYKLLSKKIQACLGACESYINDKERRYKTAKYMRDHAIEAYRTK